MFNHNVDKYQGIRTGWIQVLYIIYIYIYQPLQMTKTLKGKNYLMIQYHLEVELVRAFAKRREIFKGGPGKSFQVDKDS